MPMPPLCAGHCRHARPRASIDQLSHTLIPQADGGVLSKSGVVDYSIGKGVSPGVFVVAKMDHPASTNVWKT